MQIQIMLDEKEIKSIIAAYLNDKFGIKITANELPIKTRPKHDPNDAWVERNVKIDVTINR